MLKRTSFSRALAIAAAGLAYLTAAASEGATIDAQATHTVSGSTRLAVVLHYRDEAGLTRYLDALGDPDSPSYHRYLTNAQFRARFAPTEATYRSVASTLTRAGFRVTTAYANNSVIDVAAPSGVARAFFGAEPLQMPAMLRGAVMGVAGLDGSSPSFSSMVNVHASARPNAPAVGDTRTGKPLRSPAPWFAYGPLAFTAGYDMPVQHQIPGKPKGTTFDGTGRTIAFLTVSDPQDSDLAGFLSYFKVARTGKTTRISIDGGQQGGPNLPGILDYEAIASTAPGAAIQIVEIPQLAITNIVDAYNALLTKDVADVVDSDFSGCETSGGVQGMVLEHLIRQGAAQGQTFDSATGDTGPFQTPCNSLIVAGAPASAPSGVAVGGTELNVRNDGSYFGEDYWDDSLLTGVGGGGVSMLFPVPKYQAKVPGINPSGRNIPDVSFDGDVDTGMALYVGGQWFDLGAVGGTGLSSAIFAACAAEADQIAGHRLAAMTATLYHHWLKKGYGSSRRPLGHDIYGGVAFPPLVPQAGYDLATGIGSLDCFNAAHALL
jgi:kumamolisin